jgi:outer membrane biosynthesis protein TonB
MSITRSARLLSVVVGLVAAVFAAPALQAQKATTKTAAKAKSELKMPRTATARCGDSTWSKAENQQGACSSHGGVAKWFGKAPSNATARCNDGEYYTSAERRGACSGHAGVAFWINSKKTKKG